jgi:hypothetical protein
MGFLRSSKSIAIKTSYTKARFKGLVKNTRQIMMVFALGNLHRARRKLLEIKEQQQQNKQPKAVVRLRSASSARTDRKAPKTHQISNANAQRVQCA